MTELMILAQEATEAGERARPEEPKTVDTRVGSCRGEHRNRVKD